jgi:hypothetical protein
MERVMLVLRTMRNKANFGAGVLGLRIVDFGVRIQECLGACSKAGAGRAKQSQLGGVHYVETKPIEAAVAVCSLPARALRARLYGVITNRGVMRKTKPTALPD